METALDLQNEVRVVTNQAEKWLTVEEMTHRVAQNIQERIRATLDDLVKNNELEVNPGGGGHPMRYGRNLKRGIV
jgi:hypothetical protein